MRKPTVPARRGGPLVLLGAVAVGWIAIRVLTWEAPFPHVLDEEALASSQVRSVELVAINSASSGSPISAGDLVAENPHEAIGFAGTSFSPQKPSPAQEPRPALATASNGTQTAQPDNSRQEEEADTIVHSPRRIEETETLYRTPIRVEPHPAGRWHGDAWVAVRPDGGSPAVAIGGAAAPAYGKTQAGFVLRRDIGRGPLRPQAYARATYAPDRPSQTDLAAGLSVRPLEGLPVRVLGEGRVTRTRAGTELRPAVIAVSELPVARLPLGIEAEGYAQAGWVGGRYATPFVDGQARVDRQVAALGPARLRAGGGVWGGAQKFASRLDAGPSATLDLREGGVPVRVAVDYRFRLAGTASPGDGVAITLSTGF